MAAPSTDNALAEYPRRVQALEAQFAGFAGQMAEFGGRIAALEGRMDRVEQRLDRVEQRLDRVEQRLDRVEQRLDLVEQRLTRVEQILERVVVDLAELKGKVSQLPTIWQLVTWITGLNIGLALGIAGLVYAVARSAALR